jgi:DNA (cytosine-5)-methyltransferase 1
VTNGPVPVLSLFSGCGALDLGFRRAGFEPLLAIDNHPPAVETYNFNQPAVAELGDLVALSPHDVVRMWNARTSITPRGIIGGPPCQAFSLGNTRPRRADKRAQHVHSFASIVAGVHKEFGIDFFVLENVTGLLYAKHRPHLEAIASSLGASFSIFATRLNAVDFGVPQLRQRLFVIGLNRRRYPSVSSFQVTSDGSKPRTVRDAIGHLAKPAYFLRGLVAETFPVHPNHWTMRPRSKKFARRVLRPGQKRGRSFLVLNWNKPSWTVSYGHREIHVHPRGYRRLSIYEAMLLQGLPTDYRLLGTFSDQVRLVSDAVPPPLAHAVARTLRAIIDHACLSQVPVGPADDAQGFEPLCLEGHRVVRRLAPVASASAPPT